MTGSGDPGADVHRPGRRVHRRGDGHGEARHLRPGGNADRHGRDMLRLGDVTTEILATTGIPTPLGEVVILRARSAGNVQLAGPSITSQLREVSRMFFELGADKSIIDGALGRNPWEPGGGRGRGAVHRRVLSHEHGKVVADTANIYRIMNLPKAETLPPEAEEGPGKVPEGARRGPGPRGADGLHGGAPCCAAACCGEAAWWSGPQPGAPDAGYPG